MDILKQLIKERDLVKRKLESLNTAISALEPTYGSVVIDQLIEKPRFPNNDLFMPREQDEEVAKKNMLDKKGKRGWKEYILNIIDVLGNKVRTSDIVKYVSDNNPGLETKTIKSAARQYLWQLNNSNAIVADPIEGSNAFYYSLKKETPESGA